ncbi:MAG: hypothetical protein JXA39_04745 [Bacteroidales bacterium]|nr:hypothetical protein [Bacteroidales bacterium]MBN2863708.1 hypothetical protein [Bacteroidales bacterium]
MKFRSRIKVFEHQYLKIGEEGFEQTHFDRLVYYNELHENKYFTAGHRKIKFTNYVGVLQVGNLTIEILPKADNSSDYDKWTHALLTMLFICRKISVRSLTEAYVKIRSASILDIIFESFLEEVEYLISTGLVKGYRFKSSNKTTLKGRILFNQHLMKNIVHREQFFIRYESYDYNIVWNKILKKALVIMLGILHNATLRSRTEKLLWYFDDIDSRRINEKTFLNLRYNRKTEGYRKSIKLAELIILSYSPDIQFGRNNVLAVLFDMNSLFEEYVYRILKKEEQVYHKINLKIEAQLSKFFWNKRKIRPDIILEYGEVDTRKVIIDTKWKMLTDYTPSDDDLRQMYAYNLYFDCEKSVLLYPMTNLVNQEPVYYEPALAVAKEHACQLIFADLFDNSGNARKSIAVDLLRSVLG